MANELKLRPFELKDIPAICDKVEQYLPELPHYKNIKVAKDRLTYLMTHNYGRDSYFACWVLEANDGQIVGGIAAYCVAGMVTWDLIANDVFLFVVPEYRTLKRANDLVKAYVQWAKARGAVLITASLQSGYEPEKFDIFIQRLGFRPSGSLYHYRLDEPYIRDQLNALKGDK